MSFLGLRALLVLQAATAVLFLLEFVNTVFGIEVIRIGWQLYEFIELGILFSLFIGIGLTIGVLRNLTKRNQKVEDQLRVASGEFAELLDERFDQWGLSVAERDVALLNLKGFSVPEIAQMRGKSPGTIKAQNAAIYKKAGVAGRTQLIVSFVEDLVDQSLEKQNAA
ncbi:MAG: helix-turn-helix transcriptional regulator [Pseudomonadota bacterium]